MQKAFVLLLALVLSAPAAAKPPQFRCSQLLALTVVAAGLMGYVAANRDLTETQRVLDMRRDAAFQEAMAEVPDSVWKWGAVEFIHRELQLKAEHQHPDPDYRWYALRKGVAVSIMVAGSVYFLLSRPRRQARPRKRAFPTISSSNRRAAVCKGCGSTDSPTRLNHTLSYSSRIPLYRNAKARFLPAHTSEWAGNTRPPSNFRDSNPRKTKRARNRRE